MRYPPEHKARTRERILEAAGRVFRRDGYHAAGVDKIMAEAGLTAGGFYAHFASKEELLLEMLRRALPQQLPHPTATGRAAVAAYIERYLSAAHRDHPEAGCPVPPLLSELSRTGDRQKENFEELLVTLQSGLATHLEEAGEPNADRRALALLALCVGGLALSRALPDSATSEQLLAACRELALASLGENAEKE